MKTTNSRHQRKHSFRKLSKAVLRRARRVAFPFMLKPTQQIKPIRHLELQSILDDITRRPTDHSAHYELAEHYFSIGRVIPAIAECRTSLALGNESPKVYRLLARAYAAMDCGSFAESLVRRGLLPGDYLNDLQKGHCGSAVGLLKLAPFAYQRLKALATQVKHAVSNPCVRILDVGGGDGALCLFMPHAHYVLAEPTINGISGQKPFFPAKSFDIVVACHVLEHIPEAEKENFLDSLCSLAKTRVILLGPVADNMPEIPPECDLVYRITQASWATEHIDCRLPTLDMLRKFASIRGLEYNITPNGNRAAVFWMIFASHYGKVAGKEDELNEIKEYSNRYLNHDITNPNQPNDYFVEFQIGNGG